MKVKDLLEYNPNATISLVGLDYSLIDLEIMGFDKIESQNNDINKKMLTESIYIIPSGLKDKYIPKSES